MADWAKLNTDYYLDQAVAGLDDASEVLFTRGIAYAGHQETGGYVPAAVLPGLVRRYTPVRARTVTSQLVAAHLWVEVDGGWQIRSWDRIQADLDALAERRRADRDRQARHRALSRDCHVTGDSTDLDPNTDHEPETNRKPTENQPKTSRKPTCGQPIPAGHSDTDPQMSRDSHVTVRTPEVEVEVKKVKVKDQTLLTYVSRLAGGNARGNSRASLPAKIIEEWQTIAGPLVDLEAEARAYVAYFADRPARNERSAWIGWLERARGFAESNAPAPPCPDPDCVNGWLPDTADDRANPCRRCHAPRDSAPQPVAVNA